MGAPSLAELSLSASGTPQSLPLLKLLLLNLLLLLLLLLPPAEAEACLLRRLAEAALSLSRALLRLALGLRGPSWVLEGGLPSAASAEAAAARAAEPPAGAPGGPRSEFMAPARPRRQQQTT